MRNAIYRQGLASGDVVPAPGLNKAFTGTVGIAKAALHVDRADEVVIRKRRSLCAACPNANAGSSKTSRCLVCSCFIWPKTATASEKCPIGKW
jgi:hypothetical protein